MSRHRNRAVVGATANDVVGAFTPDQVVIGYDEYGCPVVGSFFGSLANALNPVNVVKTAWNAGTMPFRVAYGAAKGITQPFVSETQKLRSLFGGGGSAPPQPPGMPPGMSYMPPGAYPSAPGWGAAPPPMAMAPQYAPPPPQYPQQPQYAPQYAPQYPQQPQYAPQYPQQPQYDPAQYGAAFADFGDQPTGWNAAYGSGM
jgi:hypothetical protein